MQKEPFGVPLIEGAAMRPQPAAFTPPAPGKGGTDAPAAKLHAALGAVWRHRWLIVLSLFVLNGAALTVVNRLAPRYSAEASVLIGPREARVVDVKAVIEGLSGDTDVLESEIQVVRSRRLARKVVVALGLDRKPEFNPALDPPGFRERAAAQLQIWLLQLPAWLQGGQHPEVPLRDAMAKQGDPLRHVTDRLLQSLNVASKGRSRVIGISVSTDDPVLAADAANAVAEAYIDEQLGAKVDATAHAHQWLEERVAELHKQAIAAATAVENYRQRMGLMQGRTSSLLNEEVSEIGQQVVQAQVQQAAADALLKAVTDAKAHPDRLDSLPEVQQSLVMRDLLAQEATLTQIAATLTQILGPNHPQVTAIRAELESNRARARAEIGRIANSAKQEAEIATARESNLEATLAELRQRVAVGKKGEIQLNSLQQEADAERALYDRLLTRAKETQVEGGLQQPDAQMISRAEPAESPSFPNRGVMLPMFFVASVLLTALLVAIIEALDSGFSTPEQVERVLDAVPLGVLPRLPRRGAPESYVLERPDSLYAEAVRNLYTSILLSTSISLSTPARAGNVIMVTSALPGEGKSATVVSLGRLMASCGKRVVMVDCDTWRPSLHTSLSHDRRPGLYECLNGNANLAEALAQDPRSPALLLPAGSPGKIAPDMLGSEPMRKLLAKLSAVFDLVLLDSAPVLLVSDTRALGRLADRVVFVVRWQATRRLQVAPAMRRMAEAQCQFAGVVLSMADPRVVGLASGTLTSRQLRLYFAK
jgi:capsular exopolysaccharide synthesis family protein